jgi:hypothetical protein
LSNEAVQLSVTDVVVIVVARRFEGAVGATVSGQAAVETLSEALAERLPAASAASTDTWWVVPHDSPEKV